MISTAKEFLLAQEGYAALNINYPKLNNAIQEVMIEFAKLHVKMALLAASEKAICENEETYGGNGESMDYYTVNKKSILNAYPENLIK